MIAIDFETYLIGEDRVFPKPVCLSTFNGTEAFLYRGAEMLPVLTELLKSETIVAHNVVFECGVIVTEYPQLTQLVFTALEEGRIQCTKIIEQLLDHRRDTSVRKCSLANLIHEYFKEDVSASKGEDAWRMRYAELENVEEWPQEAIDYAINDSIWCYRIYEEQVCHGKNKVDSTPSVKAEVYLNLMGATGIDIDEKCVKQIRQEVNDYLKPRYDFLIKEGYCVKIISTIRKRTADFREYVSKLPIQLMYTKKGSTSITGEALEYYKSQIDDPIISAFSEIATYEKVITTYLSRMQGVSKIYSQYSATKSTGRTSSSGSNLFPSLNIQQLPRQTPGISRDLRNCFIPPDGYNILSIDYAGLELCSTAHQLYKHYGASAMRDLLNSGDTPADLHSQLAAKILKIPYETFLKNIDKEARQKAKPINLGFPGGIGYDTMRHLLWNQGIKTKFNVLHTEKTKGVLLSYLYQLSAPDLRVARLKKDKYALVQDELVSLKKDLFSLYPELERFLKDGHNKFLQGTSRWVKNEFDEWEEEPLYEYKVLGHVRKGCTYTALCNGYLMQTPSAIGAKQAVSAVMNKYYRHSDIIPLAFIHDEILFAVKKDRFDLIDDVANIMIDEMKKVLTSVRITVEASLSHCWQKGDGEWNKKYFR